MHTLSPGTPGMPLGPCRTHTMQFIPCHLLHWYFVYDFYNKYINTQNEIVVVLLDEQEKCTSINGL